jgi:hypothetical protein
MSVGCPVVVAIMFFSGIITTNLGKTATFIRGAGRERRVHHSKSLPLLSIEERLFFDPGLGGFLMPESE